MKKWILIMCVILVSSACSPKQSIDVDELKQSAFDADLSNEFSDQGRHVTIQMNKESYSLPLEDMGISFTNKGTEDVGYGQPIYFEKRVDGVWFDIPFMRYGFTDESLSLKPGEEVIDEVPVTYIDYELTPGTYRIVKEFWAEENRHALAAEFEVR